MKTKSLKQYFYKIPNQKIAKRFLFNFILVQIKFLTYNIINIYFYFLSKKQDYYIIFSLG